MFKKALNKINPPKIKDKHGFEYTVKELVDIYENSKVISKSWRGQVLSNDILKFKKSDTIFLLGSGPSINQITDLQWKYISKHDSIGFNFWFVHKFIPSLYMFQIPTDPDKAESMKRIFSNKNDQYKSVPFIIRGTGFGKGLIDEHPEFKDLLDTKELHYLNEYPISSKCSIDPALLYRYMDALGFMAHGTIAKFIPKWRGTIGLLIMLAYQMGYKKIVLCGVDMDGSDHFWDYEPYLDVKNRFKLPEPGASNIETFTDQERSSNTVPKYVYTLRDWMYKENGVEIYLVNKKSILYPEIEVFNYS